MKLTDEQIEKIRQDKLDWITNMSPKSLRLSWGISKNEILDLRDAATKQIYPGFKERFPNLPMFQWTQECNYATNWLIISYGPELSESFIREFQHHVNWYWISYKQKLSESFIREFQHHVDWEGISWKQTLSESFIREFKDKVYWGYILHNQKLSEDFIRGMDY